MRDRLYMLADRFLAHLAPAYYRRREARRRAEDLAWLRHIRATARRVKYELEGE